MLGRYISLLVLALRLFRTHIHIFSRFCDCNATTNFGRWEKYIPHIKA